MPILPICSFFRGGAAALAALAAVVSLGAAAPIASEPATTRAPEEEYTPPENIEALLRLTPEMRQFFAARVKARRGTDTQLRELVHAILSPDGLNFAYDAAGTFDPAETFRRRRGNCLSFSLLFTAVARQLGLEAVFQQVELPAVQWDRFGPLIVEVKHVNVRVPLRDTVYVVDLRRDLVREVPSSAFQEISDRRAIAEFYSNVGFFALFRGRTADALRHMTRATEIDPECDGAWANRGTMLVTLRQLAEARRSFERSLELQPRGVVALEGYVGVLRALGTPDDLNKAARLERRARAIRERNPYYHEYLAREARNRADWQEAEKRLRRAIALKANEPLFYEQWREALTHLGRESEARRAAVKLEQLRRHIASISPYIAE